MDNAEELETLIAEQAKDIRLGDFQPNEPGTVSYSNMEYGDGPEAFLAMTMDRAKRRWPECPYHGRGFLRVQPQTWAGYRCTECEKESARKSRSSPERRAKLAARTAQWRKDNPERNKEYQREYKRRRWNSDPEWREKQLARQRAYRKRRRAEEKAAREARDA